MKIVVTQPGAAPRTLAIRPLMTVGRAHENEIVLDFRNVSRRHALVRFLRSGHASVVDLGSANGTLLNGRRVTLPAPIQPGDVVQVGPATLSLVADESAAADPGDRPAEDTTVVDFQQREVTVLVTDIRGYTGLSERLSADRLSRLLGLWFQTAGGEIERRGGEIDKFIGDAVLAVWPGDADPASAVRAALDAAQALYEASVAVGRDTLADLAEEFRIGIGLHTGPAVFGNVGSLGRRELTVSGDTVNIAFRIERLTRTLPHPILFSAEIARHLADDCALTAIGDVILSGRAQPVAICALEPERARG